MEEVIEERSLVVEESKSKNYQKLSEQEGDFSVEVIAPILCQGDAIGAVVILAKEKKKENMEVEKKLATTAAAFLGKQMEQ